MITKELLMEKIKKAREERDEYEEESNKIFKDIKVDSSNVSLWYTFGDLMRKRGILEGKLRAYKSIFNDEH